MNKTFPAFVASVVAAMPLVVFVVFAGAVPGKAYAYAVGPVSPSANNSGAPIIGQGYDFTNSFQNLVSSFTSFFNNMKNTNGTVSISGSSAGTSNVVPQGVTVTVDWQSYFSRFDAWFYGATGVNIGGLTNFVIHFFAWLFGMLQGVVVWIANFLTGAIRQTSGA